MSITPAISRVILYVRDIEKVALFYETLFGMERIESEGRGWLELRSLSGGCLVALHQAAKSQKSGAAMKLVFGVKDVRAFTEEAARKGLPFGPVHRVDHGPGLEFANIEFANIKDPAGNSVSVSSRGIG